MFVESMRYHGSTVTSGLYTPYTHETESWYTWSCSPYDVAYICMLFALHISTASNNIRC